MVRIIVNCEAMDVTMVLVAVPDRNWTFRTFDIQRFLLIQSKPKHQERMSCGETSRGRTDEGAKRPSIVIRPN